jgi:hypothetical protein
MVGRLSLATSKQALSDVTSGVSRSGRACARRTAAAMRPPIGLAALQNAADEGRLAGVLEVVGEHTHQPHSQRHRRIDPAER